MLEIGAPRGMAAPAAREGDHASERVPSGDVLKLSGSNGVAWVGHTASKRDTGSNILFTF